VLAGGTGGTPQGISMLFSASIGSWLRGCGELGCGWGVVRSGEHAENVKYGNKLAIAILSCSLE